MVPRNRVLHSRRNHFLAYFPSRALRPYVVAGLASGEIKHAIHAHHLGGSWNVEGKKRTRTRIDAKRYHSNDPPGRDCHDRRTCPHR